MTGSGKSPLAEVILPAIELSDGSPIEELRVRYLERTQKLIESWLTMAGASPSRAV